MQFEICQVTLKRNCTRPQAPLASFSFPRISPHLHGSARLCSHLSQPWTDEHRILLPLPSPALHELFPCSSVSLNYPSRACTLCSIFLKLLNHSSSLTPIQTTKNATPWAITHKALKNYPHQPGASQMSIQPAGHPIKNQKLQSYTCESSLCWFKSGLPW